MGRGGYSVLAFFRMRDTMSEIEATLLPAQTGDISVVNAARVSFRKNTPVMREEDGRLIRYLYDHGHWTPFAHAQLWFYRVLRTVEAIKWMNDRPSGFSSSIVSSNKDYIQIIERGSLWNWISYISFPGSPKTHAFEIAMSIKSRFPYVWNVIERNIEPKKGLPFYDLTDAFIEMDTARTSDMIKEDAGCLIRECDEIKLRSATFRIKAPIFVARQAFKHKVDFVENEVSRRYVDDDPEFYRFAGLRSRPVNGIKQGSGADIIYTDFGGKSVEGITEAYLDSSSRIYKGLIEASVAPEVARAYLPQSMMTEWYWTASLAGFGRMVALRQHKHAQQEIQSLAVLINTQLKSAFPTIW